MDRLRPERLTSNQMVSQSVSSFSCVTCDPKKVHVGNGQEKAQSERSSHFKNRGGKKPTLTIRHLYLESIYRQYLWCSFSFIVKAWMHFMSKST